MKRQLKISFLFTLYATAGLGVVFPLLVTGLGVIIPAVSPEKLLESPSPLEGAFHGRPSMSGGPSSGASNLSLTNQKLWEQVEERLKAHSKYLPKGTSVPRDLLFASGSGYDPHISPRGALHQIPRITKALPLDIQFLSELVDQQSQRKLIGFIGTEKVNVMNLNENLEERYRGRKTHTKQEVSRN